MRKALGVHPGGVFALRGHNLYVDEVELGRHRSAFQKHITDTVY
jgi:hypothetical protein